MEGKKLVLFGILASLTLISYTQFSESQTDPADIFDKSDYFIGDTATITFNSAIFVGDPSKIDTVEISVRYGFDDPIKFDLIETENDSGIFTNTMSFSSDTSDENARILKVDESGFDTVYTISEPNFGNLLAIGQVHLVFLIPANVQCIHSPIWPQPGEAVTINAFSTDHLGNPSFSDTLEIRVFGEGLVTQVFGSSFASFVESSPGTSIAYNCSVIKNGVETSSGWKVAKIGIPNDSRAIHVQYTGDRSDRIDFVFIPDVDSYTGAADPNFLNDVSTTIDVFLDEPTYLNNQDKINFWIAQDTGRFDRVGNDPCVLEGPDNWDSDYTFADSGIIIHTDILRDCARHSDRLSSYDFGSLRTVIHESGHSPFGLADEYCSDTVPCDGGYYEKPQLPNLYETKESCESDSFNSGKTCREFVAENGEDWFTSDPTSNDVMVDRGDFQPLDLRRVNWILDMCDEGEC